MAALAPVNVDFTQAQRDVIARIPGMAAYVAPLVAPGAGGYDEAFNNLSTAIADSIAAPPPPNYPAITARLTALNRNLVDKIDYIRRRFAYYDSVEGLVPGLFDKLQNAKLLFDQAIARLGIAQAAPGDIQAFTDAIAALENVGAIIDGIDHLQGPGTPDHPGAYPGGPPGPGGGGGAGGLGPGGGAGGLGPGGGGGAGGLGPGGGGGAGGLGPGGGGGGDPGGGGAAAGVRVMGAAPLDDGAVVGAVDPNANGIPAEDLAILTRAGDARRRGAVFNPNLDGLRNNPGGAGAGGRKRKSKRASKRKMKKTKTNKSSKRSRKQRGGFRYVTKPKTKKHSSSSSSSSTSSTMSSNRN